MNLHRNLYEPSQISASRVALENVPIKLKQTTGSSKLTANNNKINRKIDNKKPTDTAHNQTTTALL